MRLCRRSIPSESEATSDRGLRFWPAESGLAALDRGLLHLACRKLPPPISVGYSSDEELLKTGQRCLRSTLHESGFTSKRSTFRQSASWQRRGPLIRMRLPMLASAFHLRNFKLLRTSFLVATPRRSWQTTIEPWKAPRTRHECCICVVLAHLKLFSPSIEESWATRNSKIHQ